MLLSPGTSYQKENPFLFLFVTKFVILYIISYSIILFHTATSPGIGSNPTSSKRASNRFTMWCRSSPIRCRLVLNSIGCILCLDALLFFIFCLKNAIDRDTYVHSEFFKFASYSYAAGTVVFLILALFVPIDLSVSCDLPWFDDLLTWHAATVAPVLG